MCKCKFCICVSMCLLSYKLICMHPRWQVRVTRQAGQIKSAIAMWRPDKFQEMNKRLMGIAPDGKAKPLSKAQCLELVGFLVTLHPPPPSCTQIYIVPELMRSMDPRRPTSFCSHYEIPRSSLRHGASHLPPRPGASRALALGLDLRPEFTCAG